MDESDILQHLLRVEQEATGLAVEAQIEADKRIAESEKLAREKYQKVYSVRVEELDAEFSRRSSLVKLEYQASLDTFRVELERKPLHPQDFTRTAEEFLKKGC
jgi:hypothetical protein